jgi:hypothetical protein
MAPRLLRFVLTLLGILCLALPTGNAAAADSPLPPLTAFAQDLVNGNPDQLVGVYVPNLFARGVVQQPVEDPAFVSTTADVLTQFSKASELGSTGLLAHNYLAGSQFSSLESGQVIYLVFGNGRTASYVISEVARYKAIQPNSAFSAFEDLESGTRVGASDLFSQVYGRQGAVILQTCIRAEGINTWGRLFVVAQPTSKAPTARAPCSACQ